MVLFDLRITKFNLTMAPTTRSSRLSSNGNSKEEPPLKVVKAKKVSTTRESPLKVCGIKVGASVDTYTKPWTGVNLELSIVAKSKKKRGKKGENSEKEADLVMDLEDVALPEGSLADFDFSETEAMEIPASLLTWYDKNHRVLPWRINTYSRLKSLENGCKEEGLVAVKKGKKSTPKLKTETEGERAYAVWVSEMMLQQTRVATVISYYQRWMDTWPTIHDLAQATQEEVNAVWAGLGYYRRARFLLEGAKQIVQNLGGKFPRTMEELHKVPGIGSYTAGAIASIAFKQAVPVVDGNVIRVLCRLRAISMNPKASSTVKLFWTLATQLVDKERPGDYNQALMELGATICTPTSPSCSSCPIASHCKALKLVSQSNATSVTQFPAKVPKAAPREEYVAVCIVELESSQINSTPASSSLLLVQRPPTGLLAGLWEFPSAPLDTPNSSVESRLTAMDSYLENTLGFDIGKGGYLVKKRQEIGTYVHVFSHIRLHMFIELLVLQCCDDSTRKCRLLMQNGVVTKWVDVTSMKSLGLTTGVKKVYKMFSALREKQQALASVTKRKRTNH